MQWLATQGITLTNYFGSKLPASSADFKPIAAALVRWRIAHRIFRRRGLGFFSARRD
jgi:hypothetical protein